MGRSSNNWRSFALNEQKHRAVKFILWGAARASSTWNFAGMPALSFWRLPRSHKEGDRQRELTSRSSTESVTRARTSARQALGSPQSGHPRLLSTAARRASETGTELIPHELKLEACLSSHQRGGELNLRLGSEVVALLSKPRGLPF